MTWTAVAKQPNDWANTWKGHGHHRRIVIHDRCCSPQTALIEKPNKQLSRYTIPYIRRMTASTRKDRVHPLVKTTEPVPNCREGKVFAHSDVIHKQIALLEARTAFRAAKWSSSRTKRPLSTRRQASTESSSAQISGKSGTSSNSISGNSSPGARSANPNCWKACSQARSLPAEPRKRERWKTRS